MLTSVQIGRIEVVSLFDVVWDPDDPDMLDPSHGPSDRAWDPYRKLYAAVFAPDGGWRARMRGWMVRVPARTILVDTGVGGPTTSAIGWYPPGRLLESLAECGVAPDDVDVVVLTHVHDDHIGGNVSTEGEPTFPNARYLVNGSDLDWLRGLAQEAEEDRAIWATSIAPLESHGVLQAIGDAYEVAPGIRTRHLPGHTPGHQVVGVEDDGASLLLSGDAINHPAQLHEPELASGLDEDVEEARKVRRLLIHELLDTGCILAPTHFGEPFGHLVSDGGAGQVKWSPLGMRLPRQLSAGSTSSLGWIDTDPVQVTGYGLDSTTTALGASKS